LGAAFLRVDEVESISEALSRAAEAPADELTQAIAFARGFSWERSAKLTHNVYRLVSSDTPN
jgi:glycosyltransferase involved in cell wall biosynthesis